LQGARRNIPLSASDMPLSDNPDDPACSLDVCSALAEGEAVANLEIAGAMAGTHEGIGPQIALDVGGDDLAGDAIAEYEPLVTP